VGEEDVEQVLAAEVVLVSVIRDVVSPAVGLVRATSWATKPPREKPSRSVLVRPIASAKAMTCRAVSATVCAGRPVEEPTPA